jgi:2,4-diketo-3-deoxy-L-fuconate hydrolase
MRLYSFSLNHQIKVGVERNGALVPLPFLDMLTFIEGGSESLRIAKDSLRTATQSFEFEEIQILAPIPKPGKIFCSGLNDHSHLAENPKARLLEDPRFFVKVLDAVIGPKAAIKLPPEEFQVDSEVELAVVIGRESFRATQPEIMDRVFGYTILNDVSARRIQFKDNNEDMGKNFDTFAPMGPCIVTADEIFEPENLDLKLWLNRKLMQHGSNRDWCFSLPRLLTWLTMAVTLNPGDVVTAGTPSGTGYFRNPQVFLKSGDLCRLQIDGIGVLENPVEVLGHCHSEWDSARAAEC